MSSRYFIIFQIYFWCTISSAENLWMRADKHENVKIISFEKKGNVRIDRKCFPKMDCEAAKALLIKNRIPQAIIDPQGYVINPISRVCRSVGGHGRIASDLNLRQYDICEFKDSSFFLSLDYFISLKHR